nr:unnamed protein product [Fasciola hepatica]
MGGDTLICDARLLSQTDAKRRRIDVTASPVAEDVCSLCKLQEPTVDPDKDVLWDTTMRRTMYACIAWPDDRLYRLVFLDRVVAFNGCHWASVDIFPTFYVPCAQFWHVPVPLLGI